MMNENMPEEKIQNLNEIYVSTDERIALKEKFEYYRVQNKPYRKNIFEKHSGKFIITICLLSAITFIGCISSDASKKIPVSEDEQIAFSEEKQALNPDISLSLEDKPDLDITSYPDTNGKYTTEGVAAVVRPSVVEIYTYLEDNNEIMGTGSGVVMNTDGYIITNTHVLDGAEVYEVVTYDGTEYEAEIVGRDAKTDIAVIKITADDSLVPAQFGDSDKVQLGEQVMAIGNPGGLTGSVTGGYVSGLNRKIKTDTTGFEMDCIQTDAAISPGNSGGALVNMYGQVIGITSSKYVDSSYEGLGFAITINEAKPVIDELIAMGYVSGRYKIGINFYTSFHAPTIFESETGYSYPEEIQGVLIGGVDENCDISNTEIQAFDFITEVEGMKVTDYDSIMKALENKKPNDIVTAHVVRVLNEKGEIREFDIQFRLMPDISGDY